MVALIVAGVVLVWSGGAAAAATPVPCHAIGHGKYDCSFYPPGDGIHGGAPVQASDGHRVGFLNQGTNYVFCQAVGAEVTSGPYHNKYWAYTKANDLAFGWVNAVWAHGGSNDGGYGGVPACPAADGHPPAAAPPPPPPPVRCGTSTRWHVKTMQDDPTVNVSPVATTVDALRARPVRKGPGGTRGRGVEHTKYRLTGRLIAHQERD